MSFSKSAVLPHFVPIHHLWDLAPEEYIVSDYNLADPSLPLHHSPILKLEDVGTYGALTLNN